MTQTEAYGEIAQALRLYFDGLYEGDAEKMREIFHPCCHLYSAPEQRLNDDDLDSYLGACLSNRVLLDGGAWS